MNMKKMWVPIVSSLVLVVALLALPVSAQAGPVRGADVSATASEGPMLEVSSLERLWNDLLAVVGLASGENSQAPADPGPSTTLGPDSSDDLTTQDAPADNEGDLRGTIEPDG